jgi:hypothetical protein
MAKIDEGLTSKAQGLGGVEARPEVVPVKVDAPPRRQRRTAVAPEREGHTRAYGDGSSEATTTKPAGGAAGAQLKTRTAKRASDLAMEQLAMALRLGGDKAVAQVQADVKIPGGLAAGQAFEREVFGPKSPLSKAKNLQVTTKLTKEDTVAVIGIAIAVTRLLNDLVPELTKLVGHLKELWAKIRHKDAKVEIAGQSYTLEEAMRLDPQALATTLAEGKAA